jgi:hypothetical protein
MSDGEARELEQLRRGVRDCLPEVEMIRDETLREQVVELHARALAETPYRRVDEIPPSGVPEGAPMTRGTQADHYRGVARMAGGITKWIELVMGSLDIDYDLLDAAALVHDAGGLLDGEMEITGAGRR